MIVWTPRSYQLLLKSVVHIFQRQIMNHDLHLFVDTVAPIIDHCLQAVWELPAKAFDVVVVVDVLRN